MPTLTLALLLRNKTKRLQSVTLTHNKDQAFHIKPHTKSSASACHYLKISPLYIRNISNAK